MADLMIDIETLATTPDSTILTVAAQSFDPLGKGFFDNRFLYHRVDFLGQEARKIDDSTIDWWATQPQESREEAFNEHNRTPLDQVLDDLAKMIWQSNTVWVNGVGFDTVILEDAYRSLSKQVPWQYYKIRDCRTVYGLWPDCPKPPTSHHALEDCRRQITMLQDTLRHLNIREMR